MKESEAKEKWCPLTVFANYTTERNEIGERYPEGTKAVIASRCIGSACMLWKGATDQKDHVISTGSGKPLRFDSAYSATRAAPPGYEAVEINGQWEIHFRESEGDCGLKR